GQCPERRATIGTGPLRIHASDCPRRLYRRNLQRLATRIQAHASRRERSLVEGNSLAARPLRVLPGGRRPLDTRPAGPGNRIQPVRRNELSSESAQLARSGPSLQRRTFTTEKCKQREPQTEKTVMKETILVVLALT